MSHPSAGEVTELLEKWTAGSDEAFERLLPLLYDELRRIAAHQLRRERAGHTLQPTALVHEAYVRLVRQAPDRLVDRSHFFAVAAKAMRRVLVDHARRKTAEKRGGPEAPLALENLPELAIQTPGGVDPLELDDALERLAAIRPRAAQIVELRYFGGLSRAEVATVLDVSETTIYREWQAARLWLRGKLTSS